MENLEERLEKLHQISSLSAFKDKNPKFFNSWRAFKYTKKGKSAGNDPRWDDFKNFIEDMYPTYKEGLHLCRIDKDLPFSKENCKWLTPEEEQLLKPRNIKLTFNGETKTLKEWAEIGNTTISAISNRYHKHKEDYTVEEIIFGKIKNRHSKPVKDYRTSNMTPRQKASKMISSYKNKDKKMGFDNVCDINIDWMIENIFNKQCEYCGDTERLGCDRINNDKPHTMDNVVPCCYECNCARNNNFSYEEMKIIGETIRKVKDNRKKLQDFAT